MILFIIIGLITHVCACMYLGLVAIRCFLWLGRELTRDVKKQMQSQKTQKELDFEESQKRW